MYYFEKNGRRIAFVSATQVERNEHPDTKGATDTTPGTFRCYTKDEFERLTAVIREADAQADRLQDAYIPVEHHEVQLRELISKEEASSYKEEDVKKLPLLRQEEITFVLNDEKLN